MANGKGSKFHSRNANSFSAKVASFFSGLFKFRKTSLTLFAVLAYVIVIALDFYAEYSALSVPSPEPYYLKSAWYDLQKISEKPHPYHSHANDEVYEYVYNRALSYAERNSSLIQVCTDFGQGSLYKQRDVFNDSSTDARIIYFESGNVLVKIQGSNPSLSAVLVSAHFDSVPTAYGTTDDGMGIASMFGILDYYSSSSKQPERSIVFNFNNDEEFGLLGATSFFNHKWSKEVEYFINLEGTGAGGRAILFRATNYGLAKYYKYVPSPFASSIFQEGFSKRFISSETDYKVYAQNGLKGFDIAFYKPRSLYHTARDSIDGTTKGSLYHMLSNSLLLTQKLANEQEIDDDESEAVYFDILGKFLVIFSINALYTFNIILLVVIPVIIIVLLIVIFKRGTWRITHSKVSSLIRLPVSLVISGVIADWIGDLIQHKNPLIVSLNYNIVLLVLTATVLLSNYIVLNFFNNVLRIHDQKLVVLLELTFFSWIVTIVATVRERPQSVSTGEWLPTVLYILLSVSSIFGLLGLAVKRNSVPTVNIIDYGATGQHYLDVEIQQQPSEATEHDNEQLHEAIQNGQDERDDEPNSVGQSTANDEEDAEASDEASPLLGGDTANEDRNTANGDIRQKIRKAAIDSLNYDWSLQFFILVPTALYFIYFNVHEMLQAIYQNSQDGTASVKQVFFFLKAFAFVFSIPIIAFSHKLNYFLRLGLFLAIIFGTLIATYTFPFNYNNPLKISFYQQIDLDAEAQPIVNIIGSKSYIKPFLQDLPSIKEAKTNIHCIDNARRPGQEVCSYRGLDPNLVGNKTGKTNFDDILSVKVLKNSNNNSDKVSPYEPLSAEFLIKVKDNRQCVLTFNSTSYKSFQYGKSPLRLLTIYHDDNNTYDNYSKVLVTGYTGSSVSQGQQVGFTTLPTGYSKDKDGNDYFKWFKGIDQVQIHKTNWTQPHYHVGVQWIPRWFDDDDEDGNSVDDEQDSNNRLNKLGINIECYWGEYDTEVQVGKDIVRKVPAYDELLQYSPNYIVYTKTYPGLVILKKYIEL